ncbi:MAG: hypothetical protein JO189_30085 [Deltaproteobacteria bacterium]|nr:hypothetical protein [Deltaproteobacteria bacterium]
MGGESGLSLLNNVCGVGLFGFLAIMHLDWRWLIGALFFGGPVQWLIRLLARIDPQYSEVHARAIAQPAMLEPHGLADVTPRRLKKLIVR